MSRTIKTDQPPLKMVVDGGRFVPATGYDAERLDTYRRGAILNVFITHEKQRVDEKRWWAAINRAVKECKTPWQNGPQASEAIKLALGIVNLTKTVGGDFMAYPQSLTERDDADLAGDVRDLFDLLYRITGVDPAEWRRHADEIRDDPDDETETALAQPPTGEAAAGSGDPNTTPPDPAAAIFTPEEREWLKTAAKMLVAASMPGGDPAVVRAQYAGILKTLTPAGISQAAIAKAGAIGKRCYEVCAGTEELDLALIAGLAGCDVGDIRP